MWEMVEFRTINYIQNTDLSMFTKKCVIFIAYCTKNNVKFWHFCEFKDWRESGTINSVVGENY